MNSRFFENYTDYAYYEPQPREAVQPEDEEELLRRQKLPPVPDDSVYDIPYVLPLFCKPGKHTYLIKHTSQTTNTFFYECEVHPRTEPLSVQVKPLNSKTANEIVFNKDKSVFKLWKNEHSKKRELGFDDDLSMWKCSKFIKDEE